MVTGEISLYILLGHLLIAVGSGCVPVVCLRCNVTGETPDACPLCSNNAAHCSDIPSNCKKEFQVTVENSESKPEESDDITLKCVHDLPNVTLTFEWKDKEKTLEGKNKSTLVLKQFSPPDSGPYTCFVNSSCGTYKSPPYKVPGNDSGVVILVICGASAVLLVVIMGLAMKYKLKRDNTQHRERMKQRARAGQSDAPVQLAPRES